MCAINLLPLHLYTACADVATVLNVDSNSIFTIYDFVLPGIISTGMLAWRTTFSATLPIIK